MIFFEALFSEVDFEAVNEIGEIAVLCPFNHSDGGVTYLESVPSAHINIDKGVFHCKVCGARHSEISMVSKLWDIPYNSALTLMTEIRDKSIISNWRNAETLLRADASALGILKSLKITSKVTRDLRLGHEGKGISFPVFVYGQLMDVRKYVPKGRPKVKSRAGVRSGYFIPDIARIHDTKTITICAGEKDMAIARSYGLNAYTLTGGEQCIPTRFGYIFKDKNVYIIYDNDDAGKQGARSLASFIKRSGGTPFVVEGHHEIATGKGEDLFDYLVKYNSTKEDLYKMIKETPELPTDELRKARNKIYNAIDLGMALKPTYRNKYVSSTVQVTALYNNKFGIPNVVEFKKYPVPENAKGVDTLTVGTKIVYSIDDDNNSDILYLMDSNLKEDQVDKNLYKLSGIPKGEISVGIKKLSYGTVYKSSVISYGNDNSKPSEIDMYSFDPVENGRKYNIIYKPVQHPLRQQEIVLIAKSVECIDNELDDFELTDEVRASMELFKQTNNESVEEAMDRLFEFDKGYLGNEASKDIAQSIDLCYSTPLNVKVGRAQIRGSLDIFMVGETRTGKSRTAMIKKELYGLGNKINLGTTTVAGLIGGTNKATNRTQIGLLPREHKGMVILEEFSSMKDNAFIKAMTDIRSSHEVRIVRVDTDLRVPCQLRMLTISNPKSRVGGAGKSMKSYPNGIAILLELIDSAEDIARYDFFTLVPEPTTYVSFLDVDYPKLPEISYKNRVRWIWTRTPEQVSIDLETQKYIWNRATELNKRFNTHVKLFGTEAWQKLVRIAIGCAGMLVSSDDDDNIVVKKGHIDWAFDFFIRLYDNEIFKLRQFVFEQRKYSVIDDELVEEIQDLYAQNSTLFNFLEMTSGVTRATLKDVSGKVSDDFSALLNEMARLYLFKWSGNVLIPSERFRKGLSLIDRNVKVERGGSSGGYIV